MDSLHNTNIFLRAKTPEKLIELQVLSNQLNAIRFAYQTPIFANKEWYVWFFADLETYIHPDSLSEDELKHVGIFR